MVRAEKVDTGIKLVYNQGEPRVITEKDFKDRIDYVVAKLNGWIGSEIANIRRVVLVSDKLNEIDLDKDSKEEIVNKVKESIAVLDDTVRRYLTNV